MNRLGSGTDRATARGCGQTAPRRCSPSMSSPVPAVVAGCASSLPSRTRSPCRLSSPASAARSPPTPPGRPRPPRPRARRSAARPDPCGLTLAGTGARRASLRLLLAAAGAAAQDGPGGVSRSYALSGSLFMFSCSVLLQGTFTPFARRPCWAHTTRCSTSTCPSAGKLMLKADVSLRR